MSGFPWSSVISGGASLIGGLLGFKSNSDTNAQNMRIAQMNNEFNERMMQKQMDYNTTMWNKQNAYNDPSAQVARYQAAGLNPYLMMSNGGTAGAATAANGVNPPTADQTGKQMPNTALGDAIAQAGSNAVMFGQQAAQISSNIETNKALQAKYAAEAGAAIAKTKDSDAFRTPLERLYYANVKNMDENTATQAYQQLLIQEQTRESRVKQNLEMQQAGLLGKQIQWFDQNQRMQLSQSAATIQDLLSRKVLNYASAKAALTQSILNIANANYANAQTETENFTRFNKNFALRQQGEMNAFTASKISTEILNLDALREGIRLDNHWKKFGSRNEGSLSLGPLGKFGYSYGNTNK